jgi:hypothetical protein
MLAIFFFPFQKQSNSFVHILLQISQKTKSGARSTTAPHTKFFADFLGGKFAK